MHDSSFWYTYGTVGPRGAREGPGGGTAPLGPPLRSAYGWRGGQKIGLKMEADHDWSPDTRLEGCAGSLVADM